ncbi:MAG: lysine--tRNA ligase [Holosporales bacterium]|jgi:lysyl-tRNA synthetase class 1|nr:lysine--tRNA ligase [Holosporales bacterium]
MRDGSLLDALKNAKSWPFEEARKILARIKRSGSDEVILETGYGPSGLPHIGTFGEVLRTTFVMNAFRRVSDIPAKIVVFSDDMDGFRKVPSNVPNQDLLAQYLDRPLTDVPDPFWKYQSFAHHNNAMLRSFLDSFGFEYEFKSSTEVYQSGRFNNHLIRILENYDTIMKIMLPSLREERQKTYSPFMPICKDTGKVLQVQIEEVKINSHSVVYRDPGTGRLEEVSVLDGNCKLQWKADWGMRWAALGVDYEMNGKDLIDSFKLSSKICHAIGGIPPENMTYELFLDNEGKKISKSKGNGLSMDEWLRYAPSESLAYYMFQSPQRAKRLYFDVIPNAMDEYMGAISKFQSEDAIARLDNPVYHIHNGNPPYLSPPQKPPKSESLLGDTEHRNGVYKRIHEHSSIGSTQQGADCGKLVGGANEGGLRFSTILNLAQSCNTSDTEVLMQFILKYIGNVSDATTAFMRKIAKFAVVYYNDFVAGSRVPALPDEKQKAALEAFRDAISRMDEASTSDEFQNVVFEVGKKFYPGNTKAWFSTLYSVLFGAESGPKIGSFVSLYGVANMTKLIGERVSRTLI